MATEIIGFNRELIESIRAGVAQLGNRVGGTSEFVALRELNNELTLPYLFVVPVGRRALQNSKGGDTNLQTFRYVFSTILAVDNSQRNKNDKSLTAMEQVEFIFSKLLFLFIGLDPESITCSDTIRFSDDFLNDMTDKRLWWQFNWTVDYTVDTSNPALCPQDDDYTITTVFSRGFMNGAEAVSDDADDYNTKNEDGVFEGGDGVVNGDEIA